MPLYEILHSCYLTESQKENFANAITTTHAEKFTTPRMFVQVRFTYNPVPLPDEHHIAAKHSTTYIGGRHTTDGNYIRAHIRSGPSRSQADFASLTTQVVDAWNQHIPVPRAKGQKPVDYSLWSVHIMADISAGWEGGYIMPTAGNDVEWLRQHWEEFEMKAQGDDPLFKDLVEDVKERDLLQGEAQTHKRRLEEMLGWGDSA